MCGIAGIIDLVGERPAPEGVVQRMARAIIHRGPDEEGFLERPGISLASRRLSIVGSGRWPAADDERRPQPLRGLQRRIVRLCRAACRTRGARPSLPSRTAIPKSFRIFGKIISEGTWERLRGQFAIALWDERHGNCTSDAIGSGSRHFSGAGRATGCSLPPKSKACSPQEWFRRDPTARDSITSSHFPRCRARGLVLKEFNFCRRDIVCALRQEVRAQSPVITERAYWEMDFPAQGEEEWGEESECAGG